MGRRAITLWGPALVLLFLLAASPAARAQSVWWEPAQPLVGQEFTIYYDLDAGTLPGGASQVWLHWGLVDALGNWSAPPQSTWPPGTIPVDNGAAAESPMIEGADNVWSLTIDPVETMTAIAFVFTDQEGNWDNNNGNNWRIDFTSGDVASWYSPEDPEPGDLLTVYYNAAAGTLPDDAVNVRLHWGINQVGQGQWQEPPAAMWPPGTVPAGDGMAVQTPMNSDGVSLWSLSIQTDDTTRTLHYVVTDGSHWDNNSGENWNIELSEPVPVVETWYLFRYDTRSSFATFNLEDIDEVYVAGPFNNWSTSEDPMNGPDERGVFTLPLRVPTGALPYKFVVNGNRWVPDPDNPRNDGSQYGNSLLILQPDSLPTIRGMRPLAGERLEAGQPFDIRAVIRPADIGPPLQGTPGLSIDGTPHAANWNAAAGVLSALGVTLDGGIHEIEFTAEDEAGYVVTRTHRVAVQSPDGGFLAADEEGDDDGMGDFRYPAGVPDGAADFLSMSIEEAAGGDELLLTLSLAGIAPETRVLLQIAAGAEGHPELSPPFATELATSDWNGAGVQVCLADPASPGYNPSLHNRLILGREPVLFGEPVTLDPAELAENRFAFTLPVSELTDRLGSFNHPWVFAAYSFLDGPAGSEGNSWEIGGEDGGVEGTFEPDVFDALFIDSAELQGRLLANASPNRTAVLDNVGRGFAPVAPGEIGPNVGTGGPSLVILSRGATTVRPDKRIYGSIGMDVPTPVTLKQETASGVAEYPITAMDTLFHVDLVLEDGLNRIWAETVVDGDTVISPLVLFTLKVNHAPEPEWTITADGGMVTLDASESRDPDEQTISFHWETDPGNPQPVTLNGAESAVASFAVPDSSGEYYFDLRLEDPDENVSRARMMVTITPDTVDPQDFDESVAWVRDAVVYEIFPRSYAPDHSLSSITADMQRLHDLGVTTLWLMPVHPGPSDHGYEITDYYNIEEDYGTPQDYADLVQTAHSFGMKVVMDLVINHTGIGHPFFQDAARFGIYSPYWDFYDRDANGNYTYYYDWTSLPNVNYDNPDAWDYFIDMCLWWVENYDIDGFRADVAWGPQTRNGLFWREWRRRLRQVKPELFLLAEADGTDFGILTERFDLAYDWNLHHGDPVNIQNMFDIISLDDLHDRIVNYGFPPPPYKYWFRFLENHDEARYIAGHSRDETKMAAALLLTLPGVPLIYAGQEIGTTSQRGLIQWGSDPNGLYPHYYRLIHARRLLPALRTRDLERLDNDFGNFIYTYGRYKEGEYPVVCVFNFFNGGRTVNVTLPTDEWDFDPEETYTVSEILSDTHYEVQGDQLATLTTSIGPKQSKIFVIGDEPFSVDAQERQRALPLAYSLEANYPNPFNAGTFIRFQLPRAGEVEILVYNLLGRQVRTLVSGPLGAGRHLVYFDGRDEAGQPLASGLYFYHLRAEDYQKTRKMVLVK